MFIQELHNPKRLVAQATTFGTLTPVTCGPSVRSLLITTLTTPRILQSFRDFQENLCNYENVALLGYYAASSGNYLQTFRDNLSVPKRR